VRLGPSTAQGSTPCAYAGCTEVPYSN
jgi:hypothetical protein